MFYIRKLKGRDNLAKNSIKRKMITAFIIVAIIFTVSSSYSLFLIKKTNNDYDYLLDTVTELKYLTKSIQSEVLLQTGYYRAYVAYQQEQVFMDKFMESDEKIEDLINKATGLALTEEIEQKISVIKNMHEQLIDTATPILELIKTDKVEAMNQSIKKINPIEIAIITESEYLLEWLENEVLAPKQKEIRSSLSKNFAKVITINTIATVIAIIISVILSNRISNPIRLVVDRMNIVASGDLSQKPLKVKLNDEIGQLVNATNCMTDNMRELINQIQSVVETVNNQSEQLNEAASEVNISGEQVVSTMQELAVGVERQANYANDMSETMIEFVGKVQEANEQSEQIQNSSNYVIEMTDEGNQLMEGSTRQMATIDQMVKHSVEKVNELDRQSQEISKLVVVIKDIAEQTNLLALNAAIEAERAGIHGKGFSVVADEVRKLAEQTASSVSEIKNIVVNIQNGFGMVSETLQNGYVEVEKGTTQIQSTREMFTEISSAVKQMVENMHTINTHLTDIASSSRNMNSSIQEMAGICQESAAEIDETTSSIEQTSSSMQGILTRAEELSQLSEVLTNLINRFKL